jgi:WD40 repeat protein
MHTPAVIAISAFCFLGSGFIPGSMNAHFSVHNHFVPPFGTRDRSWESHLDRGRVRAFESGVDQPSEIAFLLEGKAIGVMGYDRLSLLRPGTGQQIKYHLCDAASFGENLEEAAFASGSFSGPGYLGTIDVKTQQHKRLTDTRPGESIDRVSISPDGTLVAFSDIKGALKLYERKTGRTRTLLGGKEGRYIQRMAFDTSGAVVAAANVDMVHIINTRTGNLQWMFQDDKVGYIHTMGFIDQGKTLFVAGNGGRASFWDVRLRRRVRVIRSAMRFSINAYAIATSSNRLILGCGQGYEGTGFIEIWNMTNGVRESVVVGSDSSAVQALSISQEEGLLAVARWSGNIEIWDMKKMSGMKYDNRIIIELLEDLLNVGFQWYFNVYYRIIGEWPLWWEE